MQGRSITWISIKKPRNIQVNSLLEINLDRKLPKGLIPLDVLHNIQHKQPQEMLIPLLNIMNSVVKLPKNTILGSITKVDNAESIQNIYSLQHHNVKAHVKTQPSRSLLPVFLIASHMHMTSISHQYSYKMQMFHQRYNTSYILCSPANFQASFLSLPQTLEEPTL